MAAATVPLTDDGSASVPKVETGAQRFIQANNAYDGRGVTVAIFDTGVDPGAAHLRTTPDGRPKIVDIVDCTGSGDVDMSGRATVAEGAVQGLSGRRLVFPQAWDVADGTEVRLGLKAVFELFPEGLKKRVIKERKKAWQEQQALALASARGALADWDSKHPAPVAELQKERQELQAKLDALLSAESNFADTGPVYDCVLVPGDYWRCAVDVSGVGDLSQTELLADYAVDHKYATFSDLDRMNYSMKIYDDGNIASIVCTAGSHGTHVAGIVAAYDEDRPDRHGVAPGAQIVSIKIGDSRLGSMETGTGLVRGLIATLENKCDVINMSYGEASSVADVGRFIQLAEEVVNKHGVIFVASAGNNGPALSTVSCPGGTSSSIIGVGAWVSKAMMAKAYSLRQTPNDMQYTWSSRGPSTDGDLGVSISAPGAAITDVPEWTLTGGQLMNGTSMSSPNATGGIALVLSGLKARGVPYSPQSIRRALENTAINPDGLSRFDHGYGLIQVDAAFEYSVAHQEARELACSFAVNTSCHGQSGRGVYLREHADAGGHNSVDAYVTITPKLHENRPQQERIEFDLSFDVSCTASWLSGPSHFVLKHAQRGFKFQIDTGSLGEGVFYGEVVGVPQDDPSRGPLFRVPVTVVKPAVVPQGGCGSIAHSNLAYTPGQVRRYFVQPPAGATWADVTIKGGDYEGARLFALHVQQLLPSKAFSATKKSFYPSVARGDRWNASVPLHGEATVEFCLAQWWSSLDSSTIDFEVEFSGVVSHDVDMHAVDNVARMDVVAPIRPETLAPSAKLTTWTRVVMPSMPGSVNPLPDNRDLLPDGRRIYELILEYKFTQKDKAEIRPVVPVLSTVLYESAYEGQLWMLHDCHKKLLVCGDAFPQQYKVTLPKGEYTLRLQVRHDQPSALDKLKTTALLLEQTLKDAVPLEVYKHAPVAGGSKLTELRLARGTRSAIYLSGPAQLSAITAAAGDFLKGTISLLKDEKKKSTVGKYTVKYVVGPAAPKSPPPPPVHSTKPTSMSEAVRDVQIEWLTKSTDEAEVTAVTEQLVQQFPDHLPLYSALLSRVLNCPSTDGPPAKPDPAAVVVAANAVIAKVSTESLALHYGVNLDPNNTAQAIERSKNDAVKVALINALYRKCVALTAQIRELASQSTDGLQFAPFPDDDESGKVAELHATVAELKKWASPATSTDHLKWYCEYEGGCGRLGVALQALNKFLFAAEPRNAPKELWQTRDAMHLALGWGHLLDDNALLVKFPPAFPAF
eukprot:m.187358 g.187358  ORF g.187358 m.187358 type:complete len:1260 (+) comp18155_c0_seq12:47-3826(+)